MSVYFSGGDIDYSLKNESVIKKWISLVIKNHGKKLGKINYLFCSDEYVYDANVRFLNHDTYTDIITFDSAEGDSISGDIMISLDRVGENAKTFSVPFEDELHRVIIHGVLHLLGFKDKSDEDAALMRCKEEESLLLLNTME